MEATEINPINQLKPALVCGSRQGQGFLRTSTALDKARKTPELPVFYAVLSGGNKGTDGEAFYWAMLRELPALIVPAKWKTGTAGGGEGPIRNRLMLRLCWPVVVLAFPGGPGTRDMMRVALQSEIPLWCWNKDDETWKLCRTI